MDDHASAVVSDLSEYHGLSLVDVLAEHSHSPRTLLSFIAWLPDDSALAASMRGQPRGWGTDRHLLATVVDAIQANTWITAAVASKRKPKRPKRLPRPESEKKSVKARVLRVADLVKRG